MTEMETLMDKLETNPQNKANLKFERSRIFCDFHAIFLNSFLTADLLTGHLASVSDINCDNEYY